MSQYHEKVKKMLQSLNLTISREIPPEGIFVVSDPSNGIYNLVIDIEDPIIILEQLIVRLSDAASSDPAVLREFLQMNRKLVHGAFTLDEDGRKIVYRDTLQIAGMDVNELEGSINALSLGLAEHGTQILALSGAEGEREALRKQTTDHQAQN